MAYALFFLLLAIWFNYSDRYKMVERSRQTPNGAVMPETHDM